MRKRRGQKAALISVLVAAMLVIGLMIAGTVMRMQARGLPFGEALRSFVADTFHPGAN